MPSTIDKPVLRFARTVHSELISQRVRSPCLELPTNSWGRCQDLVRQIRRAELRGWHLAAEQLRRDLSYTVPTVQAELTSLTAQLPRHPEVSKIANPGDVYQDLLAVKDEFDQLYFDVRGKRLSVTTEPITLNGVYLGPFEIRLDLHRAGNERAYRVIANEPHPPDSRENVTHPHVMDETLCEGHHRHAIQSALGQGRLLDFFTLVANGLRSYNEESPFVSLELWHGETCSDCGSIVDEDERYVCQRCEDTVCSGCESSCSGCDESCCSQCISSCDECNESYCRRCLKLCKECRHSTCTSCLQEDERCNACHENEEQDNNEAPSSGAQVQSIRMGEASVPA